MERCLQTSMSSPPGQPVPTPPRQRLARSPAPESWSCPACSFWNCCSYPSVSGFFPQNHDLGYFCRCSSGFVLFLMMLRGLTALQLVHLFTYWWRRHLSCFSSQFFFFWLHHAACEVRVPQPGWNTCPLRWERGVLTSGPPGKSWSLVTMNEATVDVYIQTHVFSLLMGRQLGVKVLELRLSVNLIKNCQSVYHVETVFHPSQIHVRLPVFHLILICVHVR